ncbi:MAG: aminomethyltransferase [Sphingobacteriales bacterium]|jgi:aminomethyltransferase
MKNTPLTKIHENLGAKMAEFAGYNMPISYSGINEEHQAVRDGVGVFDVSHMGEFLLKGENALNLIQKIGSNDASKLVDGKAQYSCMPNGKGGIVDDFLIYRIQENEYLLVVNASNIEKDWNWIKQNDEWNVDMEDISDSMALLAVQGPKTAEALQSLTDLDLAGMKYYTFNKGTFAGVTDVIVSATGYTGSGGFELYIPADKAPAVWKAVFEAGKDFGIVPVGLAARDTLRLEMGFCLYGNDITDETNAIEAGLGWITKFTKSFVDDSLLEKIKANGPKRRLVGFELMEKGIARQDYPILDVNDNQIGVVTSGTMSPCLQKGIGLGYVSTDFAGTGSDIFIGIRKKKVAAKVASLPFYKGN